jgi:D-threo-aldose 1-dehydrogenase
MATLEKRRIGRTSLEVTVLGLGCATLGGSRIEVSRREAEAIVHAAWASGVRYIDAPPYYGFGRAERRVGDAMRWVPRDEWVLSTKVGRLLRPRSTELLPNLGDGRGQAASGCWLTSSMPSMNFTPVTTFGN